MDSIKEDADQVDDSEGEDRTVFVPRSAQPEEQSAEDEIATKLDLAKAYVELGDKDSAKTILDEVMAEGDDSQRQQAQELLEQI
jgi:pilus assembly protein FimV